MRNADVVASKIAAWELLVASMQPLLEEMPYLQPFHDRIQGLIGEARELHQQEEKVREEARELTHRHQAVEREGEPAPTPVRIRPLLRQPAPGRQRQRLI